MAKFRSKTVVVQAVQLLWSTWSEVCELIDAPGGLEAGNTEGCYVDADGKVTDDCNGRIGLKIPSRGQPTTFSIAVEGDWIVRDQDGEISSISGASFADRFEPATFEPNWLLYYDIAVAIGDRCARIAASRAEGPEDGARRCAGRRRSIRRMGRRDPEGHGAGTAGDAGRRRQVRDGLQKAVGDLSEVQLIQAFKNVGVYIDDCDACAELFFTGSAMHEHAGHCRLGGDRG